MNGADERTQEPAAPFPGRRLPPTPPDITMPILPLPQFEADLEEDRKAYQKLKPPTSIVVRFGLMKLVGEFPYSGDAKPGCGSKIVARTHRGVELGEMLTSTCPNAGCSKSVTRKDMLEYIENSGGRDYPFFNQGKILRIATAEDVSQQTAMDATRPRLVMEARRHVADLGLAMKVVDAEPILGGDRLTYYFASEDRVDFRELVSLLAAEQRTRIDMRQVGARDEARLTADYERCGQHCCCKQFLKVLKPVSMKSAKIQKATLDPLKISGRCGRLMCCLRYEDETYDELRKRLPRKKSRVLTPDGWGLVMDSQILTQLVLVKLEETGAEIAVAVEDLDRDGASGGGGGGGAAPAARGGGLPGAIEHDEDDRDEAPGAEPGQAGAPRAPAPGAHSTQRGERSERAPGPPPGSGPRQGQPARRDGGTGQQPPQQQRRDDRGQRPDRRDDRARQPESRRDAPPPPLPSTPPAHIHPLPPGGDAARPPSPTPSQDAGIPGDQQGPPPGVHGTDGGTGARPEGRRRRRRRRRHGGAGPGGHGGQGGGGGGGGPPSGPGAL